MKGINKEVNNLVRTRTQNTYCVELSSKLKTTLYYIEEKRKVIRLNKQWVYSRLNNRSEIETILLEAIGRCFTNTPYFLRKVQEVSQR